ncbi:MAG: hypothetical protein HY748_16895 [Elusimicrobia bacterium]|nr:hypothetical protein [Elusimicrobiota bacterium]
MEKAGPGSRYISPAAVRGQKVDINAVGAQTLAPGADGQAPGAAMADVKESAPEVSPLTETADILYEEFRLSGLMDGTYVRYEDLCSS